MFIICYNFSILLEPQLSLEPMIITLTHYMHSYQAVTNIYYTPYAQFQQEEYLQLI